MRKVFGLLFIVPCLSAAYARDLGVQGTTFEIKEQSLLEVIQGKLRELKKSGKLADHQERIRKRIRDSLENPQAVGNLTTATSYSARMYDPSIIIDEDIKDHKGTPIARKGTRINPLDYHSFGQALIMIQGEDETQVAWALKQNAKIVLVNGKPLQLAKIHNKPFYFDQGGILTKKFNIKAVPTRVCQKDRLLLIEEISIGGGR